MSSESFTISFRPLTESDLPLLHEWLARPHVAEWWGDPPSMREVERDYAPALEGGEALRGYLALRNGAPVAFIQSYAPAESHDDGWWLDEHDPGVRGLDVFLADGDQLGKGLGTAVIRAFVARLFEDPAVTRVQADPSPDNARAIGCYARAGFRPWGEVQTPDGRALLMYADRATRA